MSKTREWFKWKLRAGRRGTLRRASLRTGNGFEAMGACVAMLDHARGESHWTENPEGVFKTSIEDLAIDYSTPPERVRESLGALVATGWLNASQDVAAAPEDADVTFRVVRYLAFNDPQGSDADRQAAKRDRDLIAVKAQAFRELLGSDIAADAFAEVLDLRGSVTGCHEQSAESLEEKRREEKKSNTSDKPAAVSNNADIQAVFDHWEAATTSGRGRKPTLDTKRRSRIAQRLKEGFTAADLCQAIDGFLLSPWHNGTETGKRYLGIETVLRDAAQVERGVELAITNGDARGGGNAAAPGLHFTSADLTKIERLIGRDLDTEEEAGLQEGRIDIEGFLAEHGVTKLGAA